MNTIVAKSRARARGRCDHSACTIEADDLIFKVWNGQPGHQTRHGQGPGGWWCVECALADASDPD